MARLDVHARRDGGSGWLLDVQADLLARFDTRLVVPLLPENAAPPRTARLNPVFVVAGERAVMMTQLAAAVHVRELGPQVARLSEEHESVIAALDLLLTGV